MSDKKWRKTEFIKPTNDTAKVAEIVFGFNATIKPPTKNRTIYKGNGRYLQGGP